MKTHYVNLTDGSRLPVNINFGTLYYLQKSGAEAMLKRIGKRQKAGKGKMSEEESMEFAAKMIYVILRSNGKQVTFDEALQLTPMDTDEIEALWDEFIKKLEEFKKKQDAKQRMKSQTGQR